MQQSRLDNFEVDITATLAVERLNDYYHGGLHPVHLGDTLREYTILDKLGHGDTSTVWLGKDNTTEDRCVSIAIRSAYDSTDARLGPLRQWLKLRDAGRHHPGRPYVLVPEKHFDIEGPNGAHLCLVFPVQGQSVSAATKRGEIESRPLPLHLAKQVTHNIISGLSYCHSLGLVHGDLHPANVLLGLPSYISQSVKGMYELSGAPKTVAITKFDGSASDNKVPQYLVEGILAREFNPDIFTGPATIADWGSCFSADNPPHRTAALGPYIAPEFNSPSHINGAVDSWMLGCLIFEILTGYDLFGVKNDPVHKVVTAMMDLLGPPPTYMMEDWLSYVKVENTLKVPTQPTRSLRATIWQAIRSCHADSYLSNDDLELMVTLLESTLIYEPSERLRIDQVACHPSMAAFRS